jgi:hypothetical protein
MPESAQTPADVFIKKVGDYILSIAHFCLVDKSWEIIENPGSTPDKIDQHDRRQLLSKLERRQIANRAAAIEAGKSLPIKSVQKIVALLEKPGDILAELQTWWPNAKVTIKKEALFNELSAPIKQIIKSEIPFHIRELIETGKGGVTKRRWLKLAFFNTGGL